MTTIAQSNVTDSTKLDFYRKALKAKQLLEKAQDEVRSCNGVYRSVLKDAKKAGVTTDELTYALNSRNLDADELLTIERNRIRMLAISGVMPNIQQDLFGDGVEAFELSDEEREEAEAERAYETGVTAGRAAHNRAANPYHPGTNAHDAFDRGWITGQKENVNGMAPKIKAAPKPRKGKLGADQHLAH